MRKKAVLFALVTAGCSSSEVGRLQDLSLPSPVVSALAEPAPELRKVVAEETPPYRPAAPELAFIMPVDFGIREDAGGKGHFLAPRAHGKHNGVDFLAPVGTPLLAACKGKARSADRGGYGKVVQLVCRMPKNLGGDEGLFGSFFYAHLSRVSVGENWAHVDVGREIGAVGKTGNAKGAKIKPHLHLELIVRGSEKAAMDEKHSGVVAEPSSDRFFELLDEECLQPAKFQSVHGGVRRDRRADPFVVLMCAGKPKPELAVPEDKGLKVAQVRWSEHYTAGGFQVDQGPRE